MDYSRNAPLTGALVACAALVFGAVAGCERAPEVVEEPVDPAVEHLRRGWELFDKEDYEGAIAAYTKAIELDPDGKIGQDARNSLGVMDIENRKQSEAPGEPSPGTGQ